MAQLSLILFWGQSAGFPLVRDNAARFKYDQTLFQRGCRQKRLTLFLWDSLSVRPSRRNGDESRGELSLLLCLKDCGETCLSFQLQMGWIYLLLVQFKDELWTRIPAFLLSVGNWNSTCQRAAETRWNMHLNGCSSCLFVSTVVYYFKWPGEHISGRLTNRITHSSLLTWKENRYGRGIDRGMYGAGREECRFGPSGH